MLSIIPIDFILENTYMLHYINKELLNNRLR